MGFWGKVGGLFKKKKPINKSVEEAKKINTEIFKDVEEFKRNGQF